MNAVSIKKDNRSYTFEKWLSLFDFLILFQLGHELNYFWVQGTGYKVHGLSKSGVSSRRS